MMRRTLVAAMMMVGLTSAGQQCSGNEDRCYTQPGYPGPSYTYNKCTFAFNQGYKDSWTDSKSVKERAYEERRHVDDDDFIVIWVSDNRTEPMTPEKEKQFGEKQKWSCYKKTEDKWVGEYCQDQLGNYKHYFDRVTPAGTEIWDRFVTITKMTEAYSQKKTEWKKLLPENAPEKDLKLLSDPKCQPPPRPPKPADDTETATDSTAGPPGTAPTAGPPGTAPTDPTTGPPGTAPTAGPPGTAPATPATPTTTDPTTGDSTGSNGPRWDCEHDDGSTAHHWRVCRDGRGNSQGARWNDENHNRGTNSTAEYKDNHGLTHKVFASEAIRAKKD